MRTNRERRAAARRDLPIGGPPVPGAEVLSRFLHRLVTDDQFRRGGIGPTLDQLADSVAAARVAGVPGDALVLAPDARAPLYDLEFEWRTPVVARAARGRTVVRRLRSGVLALVRLRRG